MKITRKSVRKLTLVIALVGAAVSASALDVFTIQGYVNFSATPGPVLNNTFGIATGDSFTGTLSYDSSLPPYHPYGSSVPISGYQLNGPLISLTVDGQQFTLHAPQLWVYNDGSLCEIATSVDSGAADGLGWSASTPWGPFDDSNISGVDYGRFALVNSPGFSLPDTSLPTQLDIADWSTSHDVNFAYDFHTNAADGRTIAGGSFNLDAEITSITLAPEPWTMTIFGLGFLGLAMFRRRQ